MKSVHIFLLALVVIFIGLALTQSHWVPLVTSAFTGGGSSQPAVVPSDGAQASSSPTSPGTPGKVELSPVSTSAEKVFTNKDWSISFTLRSIWSTNSIFDATSHLHQFTASGSTTAIFISKDEAIGLSGDLSYATSTLFVAGQNVELKTYKNPGAPYLYYELFSIKENDASYYFLLKSAVADTSTTDAFIRSITKL